MFLPRLLFLHLIHQILDHGLSIMKENHFLSLMQLAFIDQAWAMRCRHVGKLRTFDGKIQVGFKNILL